MSEVINKVATDATLTELTTEDRTFLLDKVESVKEQMRAQQFAASQM
jgi:hypothetical protein